MDIALKKPDRKSIGRLGAFVYKLVRFIVLCGIAYYILYPILEKSLSAFMTIEDLYDKSVGIIPKHWTLSNIKLVLSQIDFTTASFNTIFISITSTITQLLSCTLVGYGFARFDFPFKKLLFGAVIIVLVVPVQVIITPMYLNYRYFDVFGIFKLINGEGLNLLDSIWPFLLGGITCMGLKNGLYIYLIRQFYRGVPKELEEAAKIDGAGYFSTFWQVMMPIGKPIMFVVTIFSFVWQWTDSFYSSWFYTSGKVVAVQVANLSENLQVANALTGMDTLDNRVASMLEGVGSLLVMLPLIILYVITQKNLVGGVERSGIVG